MDLKSGYPFWSIKNGLMSVYPALREHLTCDVAIIGGGVTGALVADALLDVGMSVVVLEKRDIATGSTSASTALLQYEIDTPLSDLIEMVGEDHAVRAYKLCLESIGLIEERVERLGKDCGFQRKHSAYVASSRWDVKGLKREHAVRREHGINVDWLDRSDIKARFPFDKPAGLYSYDAAEIDAYRFAHHLFEDVTQRGGKVFDRTTIEQWDTRPDGVTLTTDRGCNVEAKKLVFAAGFETQEYLKKRLVDLRSSYAMASEPLDSFEGWYEQCLLWETSRPYVYLRTTSDGRAIIGGEDDKLDIPAKRDAMLPRKTKTLLKRFNQLFPAIEFEVAFAWAGTFGETKDGLAYIGKHPDWDNTFMALGYGGNGITYSIVAANIIRDLVQGKPNSDADVFSLER